MDLPSIETSRLFLRVYIPEDLDALHVIRNDADVSRYFPPIYTPPSKEKVQAAIIRHRQRWQERGFGEFAVIEKEGGKLIGYCGLQPLDKTEEIEIFYGFPRKYWGKGYATEAAQAVLKFAFENANLPKVFGVTHRENIASQRVLERIGLKFQSEIICYEMKCLYFSISRGEFEK